MTRPDLSLVRGGRLASLLQGALNDLKRDRATAARELNVGPSILDAALGGDWDAATQIRALMVERWPISERDLAVLVDDTAQGIRVCRASEALASARILERGGAPYYEYRDTAMSELSPVRPEWIRMLASTRALNPEDPSLRWNSGHALHQLTYFCGPVDFYFEVGGHRMGHAMAEGDSAFIPSFVPHTFATRDLAAEPHILAVTFHGRVHGDVREALSLLEPSTLTEELDRTSHASFGTRLSHFARDACLAVEAMAPAIGITQERLATLISDADAPTPAEVVGLANALGVSVTDLAPRNSGAPAGVILRRAAEHDALPFPLAGRPAYKVRGLARAAATAHARGMELVAPAADAAATPPTLRTGLHQYGYVLGHAPTNLTWTSGGMEQTTTLAPGDSFYMKPWTTHWFAGQGDDARVLLFRAPGAVVPEVMEELGHLEKGAAERFFAAQSPWYTP